MPAATFLAGSNEEPATAPPLEIPQQLTYRNLSDTSHSNHRIPPMAAGASRAPARGNIASSADADDAITVVPTRTATMRRTATRQVDWAVESATPSNKKSSLTRAKTVVMPDAHHHHQTTEKKSKKRGSSFFSFLAVKEPTSGALEKYAELQRKQAAEKGTAFMAGVPSQKLPAEIPKVNTKWDGLPQSSSGRPDLRRASTISAGMLYGAAGRRRDSVATTNSSSKASRRSQKSVAVSEVDFDQRDGPPPAPPSLESLSIKSNPRHDSGAGVYEPVKPPTRASTGDPSRQMSGALASTEAEQAMDSNIEDSGTSIPSVLPEPYRDSRRTTQLRTTSHNRPHSLCILPSIAPKEIAPWAEPAEQPSDLSWPSYCPRSCGVDDVDFITSSPISGVPEKSIEEQIADAERKTASVCRAARRMPPSSNAQALAQLERPDGDKEKGAKSSSSKQKKERSRFMRFAGKS